MRAWLFSQRITSVFLGAAGLYYAAASISACKPLMPKSDSDLQTLDDFADRNATNLNVCSGGQGALQGLVDRVRVGRDFQSCGAGNTSASCETLRSTLTAVPKDVQSAYLALGGSFLLTDKEKVVEICRNALQDKEFDDAEVRKISGCLAFDLKAEASNSNKLVIVVENDPALIKHNIVRLFGYMWTQFVPNVTHENGLYVFNPAKGLTQREITTQNDIAVNFFKDIYAKEKLNGLKKFESRLGADVVAALNTRLEANSSTISFDQLFSPAGLSPSPSLFSSTRKLQALRDTVFAEAFDSMNCNAGTLESARARFQLTFNAFSAINESIKARARELSGGGSLGLAAPESPSLALADASPTGALMSMIQQMFSSYSMTPGMMPVSLISRYPQYSAAIPSVVASTQFENRMTQTMAAASKAISVGCSQCPPGNCTCGSGPCIGCSSCSGGGCAGCSNCQAAG